PNGAWAPTTPSKFTYADGVYTLEIEALSEFKISTVTGEGAEGDGWPEFNGGALTCKYGKEPGVAVPLEKGDANIAAPISGAKYTITVAGDLSTIKLDTEAAKPTTATALYLKGGMNDWTAPDEWKLTPVKDVPENTLYSFTCAEGQAIAPEVEFKIATADWSSPNIGAGDESVIMLDTDTEVFDGSNTNFTLEEEWTGKLYVNLDIEGSIFVYFTSKDGDAPEWWTAEQGAVNTIEADNNVAAKYFNLQGVQVANPENGLFIVVKGNKASKVLVK
ncbi:MAG: hypothetical protein K2L89_01105, partial [Muribaculaceae bacterium]|nr:hypothetical protein [Muribaculaceae bacterium]